ncbi:non-homologous end-joining DNA ligase [Mycobacterium avium]|uniref:non-homologous end-joining DNA ligase n=1 Tax=Mycobacterium avium TaxID=1764 RepID=UPI0007A0D161|nr:non-homologous end-joining DNA ligase [Mycobacterium avium]
MTDFAALPDSVRAALRDEPVPQWCSPTLATLTEQRFSDPHWIFERKFDGMRCLAFRDGDRVRLLSRNRKPLNGTYPELVEALAAQRETRFVLDGEVVAFEGRRTSFARLQGRLGITDPDVARASSVRIYYYVFDLLHLDGKSTVAVPLIWRKRLLRKAIDFTDPLRYAPHRVGDGMAAYRAACGRGDEGVIAKRAESAYDGRRSENWLKFKCVRDQEFVVGGYTSPKGKRLELGALLLGYYQGDQLRYAGKVGTGFDEETLHRLHQLLSGIACDTTPFTRSLVPEAGAHWVRPELVVQIGFTEWTRDGKLRHPRYLGIRTDKDPTEVIRETR